MLIKTKEEFDNLVEKIKINILKIYYLNNI